MTKRLTIDSTGAVVMATKFVAQRGNVKSTPTVSPLQKLDKVLSGKDKLRILVYRDRGGIGDMLMITPTLRAIKQRYDCELDVATCPDYWGGSLVQTLANNPHVDNIVDYRTVDKAEYQTTVNLSCPAAAYEKPGVPPINRVDLFARGAGLSTPLADPSLEYSTLENEKVWARQWVDSRNLSPYKLIVIQANSSSQRRDMPQRILQQGVMKILRHYRGKARGIVILHDTNKTPDVNWQLEGVTPLVNFGIRQVAAITELADLVICPDSAILHLANAFHKKTVALFGPTDPRARVNYHPEAVAIWPGGELSCRNCWYTKCWNNFGCWKRITDDMIFNAGIALLENRKLPKHNEFVNFGNLIEGSNPNAPDQPFEVL